MQKKITSTEYRTKLAIMKQSSKKNETGTQEKKLFGNGKVADLR